MKKTIFSVVVLLVMFLGYGVAGTLENTYSRYGVIDEVRDDNYIIIVDETGNEWGYYSEDFEEGQEIKMTMFTNYTLDDIEDDEIQRVSIR